MLKPLFGFDITEDINNQTFYADKFAVKKVDAEIEKKIEESSAALESTAEKAKIPAILTIAQHLLFYYGLIVVLSIFANGPKTLFENSPIIFITGIPSLILGIGIWLYSKNKEKNVCTDPNTEAQLKELEEYAEAAFDNLGVPKDAKTVVDLLLFSFKFKDGKLKITSPVFYNHVYKIFLDGFTLCIADVGTLYSFPLENLKAIRKINKNAIISQWNKEEPYNKGEYKKYKMSTGNFGITTRPYYVLEIEKDGEEYGIHFPCYELPTFEALTGLTVTDQAE